MKISLPYVCVYVCIFYGIGNWSHRNFTPVSIGLDRWSDEQKKKDYDESYGWERVSSDRVIYMMDEKVQRAIRNSKKKDKNRQR